ncbi:MAG: hypothetical protein FWC75_02540 [Oscillospiraceae bacterium]|nr:hypothetical protein [Oscillospiraceae bacterium]
MTKWGHVCTVTREVDDCLGMPVLIDALSKSFSQSDMEKICYGNALRLFREHF